MARFEADKPNGIAVQELEALACAAVFKSAKAIVGFLLQQAADRIDASYHPKPGEQYKRKQSGHS